MRKLWTAAAAAVCLATFLTAQPRAQKDDNDSEAKRVRDAATVFDEIMAAGDKSIPAAILGKATGIAIFPSTIQAGLVVGGLRGRGLTSSHSPRGWAPPPFP